MSVVDAKDIILFIIAVFGCLFGIYQWIHKNNKEDSKEEKDAAVTSTVIMTELKHIGGKVDEIKTDVKVLKEDHIQDRKDLYTLNEKHRALEGKVTTAFTKIDDLRENMVTRKEFQELQQDVEDLRH